MDSLWLYTLPKWLMGILITGTTLATGMGGYLGLHRLFPGRRDAEVSGNAVGFLGVICAFYSLLLAFSAVLVWQDFQDSDQAVSSEANTLEDVCRDLSAYGGPQAKSALAALEESGSLVVREEWPLLAQGQASPGCATQFNEAFTRAAALDPRSPREQAIFGEIFHHLNELGNYRAERISDAQSSMPVLFWAVVLLSTVLLMIYTAMLPRDPAHIVMVSAMLASIGLLLFFIVALDHPFSGDGAVDPGPLEEVLGSIRQFSRS
jgi:hypothetical protein